MHEISHRNQQDFAMYYEINPDKNKDVSALFVLLYLKSQCLCVLTGILIVMAVPVAFTVLCFFHLKDF